MHCDIGSAGDVQGAEQHRLVRKSETIVWLPNVRGAALHCCHLCIRRFPTPRAGNLRCRGDACEVLGRRQRQLLQGVDEVFCRHEAPFEARLRAVPAGSLGGCAHEVVLYILLALVGVARASDDSVAGLPSIANGVAWVLGGALWQQPVEFHLRMILAETQITMSVQAVGLPEKGREDESVVFSDHGGIVHLESDLCGPAAHLDDTE
mmetsp:Transcript_20657/g.57589  ORF Transcript_20657/g.57589 Transcript_20657/m.57589 type:complete len:207 (-) Transcript_20657:675-1295(-)